MNLLQSFEAGFKKVFSEVNKVITEGDNVAVAAQPVVDLFLPAGTSVLYNMTTNLVKMAEVAGNAAATSTTGNGVLKAAAVLAALKPLALQEAAAAGVNAPTDAQIAQYIQGVYLTLTAWGTALTTQQVATATQTPVPTVTSPVPSATAVKAAAPSSHAPTSEKL
jgi:hypothetical protein